MNLQVPKSQEIDLSFKEQFTLYLEKLRKNDSDNATFGSGSHEYKFGPKLSDSDILAFEKENNCKLPNAYKIFLTEFGNGGAGPSYGVFALGTMDSGFDEEPWPDYIKPGETFRFTEAYNNDENLDEGEPLQKSFKTKAEFEEAHEYWYYATREPRQDRYYEEHSLDGAIPICHHGCAQRSWLVVDESSPEFGNIWNDLVADEEGVEPDLNSEGERLNFADWILDWCADTLENLQT